MLVVVLVLIVLLAGGLLAGLGVLARRQHERAGDSPPVLAEPIEDLTARAEVLGAAAETARQEADEVRQHVDAAEQVRDQAEDHYRVAQFGPQPEGADETRLLVERAALDAYRRGELSATQLDAIWRHVPGAATVRESRDGAVQDARRQYEHAAAEAARVRHQAYVTEVAAEVLKEEEQVAEGRLSEAQKAAGTGLPGLFAP